MKLDSRATAGLAAFLTPVVLLLPFAGKAFHIDDPLFVWMARHIVEHPFDPFGVNVFWSEATEPMHLANQNPPGIAYWLALTGSVFGWNEVALHASTAVLAGLAGWGVYVLARELCDRPVVATMTTVLTPAFLVSASTVMSDVPMLALYVWGLALWVSGVKRDRPWLLVAAAALMGAAFLMKYFALTAIPLALVYTAMTSPTRLRWAWLLVVPIAVAAAYVAWGLWRYDTNLLSFAAEFALRPHWRGERTPLSGFVTGLAFSGACGASVLVMAPFLWPKHALPFVVGGTLAVIGAVCVPAVFAFIALPVAPTTLDYRIQTGIWIAAGLHLVALLAANLYRRRDACAVLLTCWVAGTFVFSVYVNHLINVRTLLPMAPALGILAAHRMEYASQCTLLRLRWAMISLLLAGALSLWVAAADYEYANASRTAAREFSADRDRFAENVYFYDHWGFQYYMEEAGARTLESGPNAHNAAFYRPLLRGDTVAIAHVNSTAIAHGERYAVLAEYDYPMRTGMSTMTGGAGFYSHFLGMLPFVAGRPESEAFRFVSVP